MEQIQIEQALYGGQAPGGYRFLAQSSGFREEWLPATEQLCTAFGERPAGVACPAAVFAQPFAPQHVAIVQVADQGQDDAGRPGALAFRLLFLKVQDYTNLGGDPFLIADRFPPPWHQRGELPVLTWPSEPLPRRTVAEVQRVLQPPEESPLLLGAAQALVDGGKLVLERPGPAPALVRGLWSLLPYSTRCRIWPASFVFSNALGFDVAVVPQAVPEEFPNYLTEQQAGDYPEGHYELNLQIAAEAGDQRELDLLFARRSQQDTWKLGWWLLGMAVVLVVVGNLLLPALFPAKRAVVNTKLRLPAAESYPTLSVSQRQRLHRALHGLADRLEVRPPAGGDTPEGLLTALAARIGSVDGRDAGPALASGPPERRLRALLWQQGLAEYNDPRLNPLELVERLEHHVVPNKQ
jgi:hypothetical protein